MTADDVAQTLGVSATLVYRTARLYGLKYRRGLVPPTPREKARIVHLALAGLTDAEIKDRLEVSIADIRRTRLANGLQQRGRRLGARVDRATHVKIARMHLVQGMSYRDIAKAMGVTTGVVAGAVYRARHRNWDLSVRAEKEVETA